MSVQAQLVAGLLDPDAGTPAGLQAPAGASVDARFNVYRNNVTSSLATALEDGFPVVRQLLGKRYFRSLALAFVCEHPPATPILARYGDGFASYIDAFPPLADKRWLADVAQLEWLRREANDASDASTQAAAQIAAADPDSLDTLIPHCHPATRWMASPWPVLTLWQQQHVEAGDSAESVLVVRPSMRVAEHYLPVGGTTFLELVDGHRPLGDIAVQTLDRQPDTDLTKLLALLVQSGALSQFDQP